MTNDKRPSGPDYFLRFIWCVVGVLFIANAVTAWGIQQVFGG